MRHLAYAFAALLATTAVGRADPVRFRLEYLGFAPSPEASTGPVRVTLTGGGAGFEAEAPGFAMSFALTDQGPFEATGHRWLRPQLPLGVATVTRWPDAAGDRFWASLDLITRLTDLTTGEQDEFALTMRVTRYHDGAVWISGSGWVEEFAGVYAEMGVWTQVPGPGPVVLANTVYIDPEPPIIGPFPEPSTFTLLGLGGLGLLAWRRRRPR